MDREQSVGMLQQVIDHCVDYRASFALVFAAFSTGISPQEALFNLLVVTTRLYLDCLLILRHSSALHRLALDDSETADVGSDVTREMELRKQFRVVMEGSKSWSFLTLDHPMAFPQFRTQEAYLNHYALHLPEMHEETFFLEECAQRLIKSLSSKALVDLEIGLKHLCFNHAIFAMPILQWQSE